MSAFEQKYRKKPGAESSAPAPATTTKGKYEAFAAASGAKFDLWFRTNAANKDTDTSIPYSRRNHMITDGSGYMISLHYDTPIISVTLQGRNLQGLFEKLLDHEVVWVMEFDPRKSATPPADAPCITGIDIKRKPLPEQGEGEDRLPGETTPSGTTATH